MRALFTILIALSMLRAVTFPTPLGECELNYAGNDARTMADLKEIILSSTAKMSDYFGEVTPHPYTIDVVNSTEEFNKLTHGYAPEWSIAITQSRIHRIAMLSYRVSKVSYARFRMVLVHEMNHLYLHQIPNFGLSPAWYVEGLAMRETSEMTMLQKIKISQSRWQNSLIPLVRLYSMQVQKSNDIDLAYGQSAAAVYAMTYYYGENVHRDMMDRMREDPGGDADFAEIFQQVTGDDLLDFQEKYTQYIRQNYSWMFLLRTPNYLFVVLPVILVAGYFLLKRRNRKKLALWEIEDELTDMNLPD